MPLSPSQIGRLFCAALAVGTWPVEPVSAEALARACDSPRGSRSTVPPAKAFRGRLERLRTGRPIKLDGVPSADVYVLYFGASWCGPCRAFARAIKPIYESGEPAELGYELIFVSQDTPPKDVAYVKAMDMPWPYLRAEARSAAGAVTNVGGHVLPDLVVIDRSGRILCQAVDATGRSAGVRRTFEQMRAARRSATFRASR